MRQTLAIQSNNDGYVQAEAFIGRVCEQLFVDVELANVTMSVLNLVSAVIHEVNKDDVSCQILLECGNCLGGMYFKMTNPSHAFNYRQIDDMLSDQLSRSLFVVNSLSDSVQISEGGFEVRLEFALRGVESPYARKRQSILQNFMATHAVEA